MIVSPEPKLENLFFIAEFVQLIFFVATAANVTEHRDTDYTASNNEKLVIIGLIGLL